MKRRGGIERGWKERWWIEIGWIERGWIDRGWIEREWIKEAGSKSDRKGYRARDSGKARARTTSRALAS